MGRTRIQQLEQAVEAIVKASGPRRLSSWDAFCALNLAVACPLSYWIMTSLMSGFVASASDILSGMWAVSATVFVFRTAGVSSLTAGIGYLVATGVSFLLCLAYLALFPFTALGLGAVIGAGVVVLAVLNRRDDIIMAGVTSTILMVVARMRPEHAWVEPLLRMGDTLVGLVVGLGFKWAALVLFVKLAGAEAASPGRPLR